MIAGWARRTAELHRDLRAIAELGADPRWWLLAGGAALAWDASAAYVISDAEPAADTFIGYADDLEAPAPFADAIARARAARDAIRALDGALPDQPLAVTVKRTASGAIVVPSDLDVVAFAIGERTWTAELAARVDGDAALADDLARIAAGGEPRIARALGEDRRVPFLCVTLGDEPLETARHGHRRAWLGNGEGFGPWLGLSRAGGLAIASTCHMVLDGFGHAWLVEELRARLNRARLNCARSNSARLDRPAAAPGAIALGVAWQPLAGHIPSALPVAYALGRLLHRVCGPASAPFSPTFQIPVAPGVRGDPERRRRRVVPAIASVRFDRGAPEPFPAFAARTRALLAREADGAGPSAQLLAAAQAAPAPLAWKRRAVSPHRPRWLDDVATLIGGRGCVSRIRLPADRAAIAPACAVSSPGRLPTARDPLGGCVVTIVDDGAAGAITLCGAGFAGTHDRARALLAELLALLPESG